MLKVNNQELKEIFSNLKENKSAGFEKLYSKYKNLVYGIAFSILKNKIDAEDVVQIVFTKIYELDKSKLPTDKESAWLYTLTKNESINALKKAKNKVSLDNLYEIEDKNNDIDKSIDYMQFNKLISKLSDKEKEIVSLKILSGFSFKEISALTNEPIGTVKWRYYKSLHSIKLIFGNLAMFIITFVLGIKSIISSTKVEETPAEQNTVSNTTENTTTNTTVNEPDQTKSQENDSRALRNIFEEENSMNRSDSENTVEENIISKNVTDENITEQNEIVVQEENIISDTTQSSSAMDYKGFGLIGLSIIFFILLIIFLIKNQLKPNRKLSK